MTGAAPLVRTIEETIPAAGAAVTQDQVIGEAPFAGTVTAVSIIPEANATANATNHRTFLIHNKGQAGAGSTVVASLALDTPGTDDLVAFDEKSVPLSGTPANLTVAAGDVLACVETVTGTGLAHSGYRCIIEISRS